MHKFTLERECGHSAWAAGAYPTYGVRYTGKFEFELTTSSAMMYSFESSRSLAYSSDMRWRMVYQRCQMGLSYPEMGKRLNVDPSTVQRTVQLFEETGEVLSIQGHHDKTTKKLSTHEELVIIEAVLENPGAYPS